MEMRTRTVLPQEKSLQTKFAVLKMQFRPSLNVATVLDMIPTFTRAQIVAVALHSTAYPAVSVPFALNHALPQPSAINATLMWTILFVQK